MGMQEFGVIFGCRASSSLQFELPPWCSLGKNVFVSIPLVIFLSSPLRGSADQVRGPGVSVFGSPLLGAGIGKTVGHFVNEELQPYDLLSL